MSFRERYRWIPHVIGLELRKVFAYRVAFWVQYILGTGTSLIVAYYLWKAIFENSGQPRMQGFSFQGILFYYVFAVLGSKIVTADFQGKMSREIFEGTLTRYLMYPTSFLGYMYTTFFTQQLVAIGQLLVGLVIAVALWGLPSDSPLTAFGLLEGIVTALMAGLLYFLLCSCLEFVAFWQDTVWNLIAMLRFIGSLLGGLLVPIAFFPEWGRVFVTFTPFPLVFSFPVRCFLGQVSFSEWLQSTALLAAWTLSVGALSAWIWVRGTRQYTGVGI